MEEKFNNKVELNRKKVRKIVPQKFHKWLKVFEKAKSKKIPVRKPWDHIINLKKDFIPKNKKIYLMLREKKKEVREFVKEQLRKVYQTLKVTLDLAIILCRKKNRKKRIVQDYQYLNKETVKNNYLLLLILNLIDMMGTKKVFTKIDLRWEYNNVWIKERDEQKTIFTIYLGMYKPTVIFFGLINLLATFQAIMNNILRDLIDTGDVVAFIDNVLVGTKDRKHNKIVEKVLKRIEKNNLYIKLEKYAWKVKEIDFLGLVMKTEEIKIQKEKVARVLE